MPHAKGLQLERQGWKTHGWPCHTVHASTTSHSPKTKVTFWCSIIMYYQSASIHSTIVRSNYICILLNPFHNTYEHMSIVQNPCLIPVYCLVYVHISGFLYWIKIYDKIYIYIYPNILDLSPNSSTTRALFPTAGNSQAWGWVPSILLRIWMHGGCISSCSSPQGFSKWLGKQ